MRTLLSFTIRLSAIVAALAWFGPAAHSQTSVYPVRTVSVLSGYAPYSLDGFVSQPGKFQVQVLTDDVTLANYPVKLKLTLQSSGVRISTSPNYRQAPLYLNGGEMTALGADDLAPLFDPANLAFEGYSKNQYAQTGQLPEGVYRVWVDVVDYYRNVTVSKGVPAIAMVYLARAPQLSFPTDGSSIDPATSLQTRFSWMAYHPANPGAEVVYRFRMWEVKPQGRNPYEVTTASVPVFEEETTANSLLYGPDKPLLQTGSRYVWQVQAIDLQGATRFQNDGKSNALSFTYGTNCPIPSPKIDKVSATSAKLKWDGNLSVQMYRIDYRASDSTRWNTLTSDTPWAQMGPLVPSTSYEATVTAICGETEGETSPIVRFKSSREVNYACGSGTGHTDLSNTEPLPTLYRFDEFRAADFTIEADEVEGADGTFSGTGYALVPYLGFLKMKVVFKNIFINTDRRMVRGQVEFVYDEATGKVIGFGRSKGAQTVTDPVAWLSAGVGQTVAVNADVAGVSVSGNTVTVTLADGSVQTVTARDSATTVGIINPNGTTAYVADPASGLVYSVPVPGAANGEAADSSPVLPPSVSGQYGCTAVFTPSPATRYGFDRAGTPKNKPDGYFKRSLNGDAAHWKSLPAGGTDYVTVTVDGGCPTDSMRFLRESGLPVPSAPDGKAKRLLLTGTAHGDEELLTAALSTKRTNKDSTVSQTLTEAGALALVSYSPIAKTVKLVSVNGSKNKPTGTADIQKRLNEIYSPAVVSWTVLDGGNIDVPGLAADGFKTSGLALASRYTADMNRVIEAYNARPDNNTLVLFFVDAADGDKLGFMPLTGSYGFIFKLGGNVELLAHELAHGAFNLRHTFSSKSFWRENGPAPVFPERSTPNLLDYAGGTELWKYQWDLVHDPETVWFNFLQSESEGAMTDNVQLWIANKAMELSQKLKCELFMILHVARCSEIGTSTNTFKSIDLGGQEKDGLFLQNLTARVDDENKVWTVLFYSRTKGGFDEENSSFFNKDVLKTSLFGVVQSPFLGYSTYPYDNIIECSSNIDDLGEFACKSKEELFLLFDKEERIAIYTSLLLSSIDKCLKEQENDKVGDQFLREYGPKAANSTELEQLHAIAAVFNKMGDALLSENNSTGWSMHGDFFRHQYEAFRKSDDGFADFLTKLNERAATYERAKAELASMSDPERIAAAISGFSAREIELLPLPLRTKCLESLADSRMTGSFNMFGNDEEYLAIRLFINILPEDITGFIIMLQSPADHKALIVKLMDRMDDGIFGIGGDNYKNLVQVTEQLISRSPDKEDRLNALFTEDNFQKRLMNWQVSQEYVGAIKVSDVQMDDNAKISVTTSELTKIESQMEPQSGISVDIPVWNTIGTPTQLSPFDLVIFVNNGNLDAINDATGAATNELTIKPAIFLSYAAQKEFNHNVTQAAASTADVATILASGGTLAVATKLSKLRKAWLLFEALNSGINLTINLTDLANDPQCKEAVDAYNTLTCVLALGELSYTGAKNLPNLIAKAQNSAEATATLVTQKAQSFYNAVQSIDASKLSEGAKIGFKKFQDYADALRVKYGLKAGTIAVTESQLIGQRLSELSNLIEVANKEGKVADKLRFERLRDELTTLRKQINSFQNKTELYRELGISIVDLPSDKIADLSKTAQEFGFNTLEDIVYLNHKASLGLANADEIAQARKFCEKAFPLPKAGDKLKKVLPISAEQYYLGSAKALEDFTISGYVAPDHAYLSGRKASDIYENLRLDYVDDKTGKLNEMTGGYFTVEFDYVAPNKGTFKRAYDMNSGYPYTNTGMISSKRTIIPEFVYDQRETLPLGTTLKRFDQNGNPEGVWRLKLNEPDKNRYIFEKL